MAVANPVVSAFRWYSGRARRRRAAVFRALFDLDEGTRVLDLGSGDGSHLHSILADTRIRRCNVFIADIDRNALAAGHRRYGYTPVEIDESTSLPFPDGFFDVVYCSSVIEHVTIPKASVWSVRCGREFRARALTRQRQFAAEIERLGRQYFVQTPNRYFPLESHSWLPFVSYLPRPALVPLLGMTNRFWVKQSAPDWNLLDRTELSELFTGATIVEERSCGLAKSLMAIRTAGKTEPSAQMPDARRHKRRAAVLPVSRPGTTPSGELSS